MFNNVVAIKQQYEDEPTKIVKKGHKVVRKLNQIFMIAVVIFTIVMAIWHPF